MVDILLVTGSYFPREGGAERQLRELLTSLSSRGYKVAVVTQSIPGSNLSWREKNEHLTVYRLGSNLAFKYLPRLGLFGFIASGIVLTFRLKPRAVITSQLGSATAVGAVVSRLRSVPHVVRLAGGGTGKYRSEVLARSSSTLGRLLVGTFWRSKTTIVAPAKHLLSDFLGEFPNFPGNTMQIINGVKQPPSPPKKDLEVVWYSRSGVVTSTEDFFEIARALPEHQFSVIGKLEETQLPDNVTAYGWISEPESFIGRHRVLLNTSPSEGMPNTVLQAISWNCRVVGFENSGMSEVRAMYPSEVSLAPLGDKVRVVKMLKEALGKPV